MFGWVFAHRAQMTFLILIKDVNPALLVKAFLEYSIVWLYKEAGALST